MHNREGLHPQFRLLHRVPDFYGDMGNRNYREQAIQKRFVSIRKRFFWML